MGDSRIYLTVGKKKLPDGQGYLAVISQGSPQKGDAETIVLDCEVVPNMKAAKAWYRRQMLLKPWEARN